MPGAYDDFLAQKRLLAPAVGFEVDEAAINEMLFPFQRAVVRWAVRRGRAALFEDCGLGKTPQQLEWARLVSEHTGGNVLILTPLAVAEQTAREGEKFGVPVTICKTGADVRPGVNVVNYERLHHFDPAQFSGIVLDESSILKSFDGATRKAITDFARSIHYRLACTATPAPNDLIELTNHAEFLDVMSGKEIIALFFKQDGNTTHKWRLKKHAARDFWRWMASWCIALRKPSDIGFSDDGFVLPALFIHQVTVSVDSQDQQSADQIADGTQLYMFPVEAQTLSERRNARRLSLSGRVQVAADVVAREADQPWALWCDLNVESEALTRVIDGAVEVKGSDSDTHKADAALGFARGDLRVLVTKPSICGWGMNWQHCARMVFVGLSDSYEALYQALRRSWRFGQQHEVHAYVVVSELEGAVVRNIQRKEAQMNEMFDQLVNAMQEFQMDGIASKRDEMVYREDMASGDHWTLYLGDCVNQMRHIADESVGLSVFSPPFPGMYAYTNSAHDMGNVQSIDEMIAQFSYLIPELYRVTMPGRSCCIHLTQAVAFKGTDGFSGLRDFRGKIIVAMEQHGWILVSERTIDKDPQVKAVRTNDAGLQFKSLAIDSARMTGALPDYLLQFRREGVNPLPIRAGISTKYDNQAGWITNEEWIEWAGAVWYGAHRGIPGGIRETDVLNAEVAASKEADDEKHLCPLQLGVIERCIKLWSAPGDLVLSPFAGIGSEGYEAVRLHRRFVGIELKESYWRVAQWALARAEQERGARTIFDLMAEEAA